MFVTDLTVFISMPTVKPRLLSHVTPNMQRYFELKHKIWYVKNKPKTMS